MAQSSQTVQTMPLIEAVESYGRDNGQGNLVGVQTALTAVDYASPLQFQIQLDGYMAAAQAEGWLRPNSIVIFPEHIGAWLLVAGEHASIFQAQTTDEAIKRMIRHNLLRFGAALLRAKGQDRIVDALFRMKAKPMARIYQETFSRLARQYEVTIVAGSIFLPEPQLVNGRLQPGRGGLQNVSCVFGNDGRIHPHITRKNNPVLDEISFLQPGSTADLPVYDTPAGRLGVLICADAWYPAAYKALAAQDVQLIAIPNNQGDWHKPWPGYATPSVPPNVDIRDVGALTEREAWLKYALPGRVQDSGAMAGMHVFTHGRLWDQVSEGQTISVNGDKVYEAPDVDKAALVNMWL